MKLTLFLLLTVLVICTLSFHPDFEEYKTSFNKNYSPEDEPLREKYFLQSLKRVNEHNSKQGVTYKRGINHLSDLSSDEYLAMLGHRSHSTQQTEPKKISKILNLPTSYDWRARGAVTPIKDQGQCGSCWAFSTTGVMEGGVFLQTNKLISLSEQELVDCDHHQSGCNGGLESQAMGWVAKYGLDKETDYPYTAKNGKCKKRLHSYTAKCKNHTQVPKDVEQLMTACVKYGPISIAIDASHESFQEYQSGVYYEPNCGNTNDDLDHAVLVVGYGSLNNEDYWIVKNSWSADWGLDGYIHMKRSNENNCGVMTDAWYVTGCEVNTK
ncbi:hypothetical protein M0813_08004 [Anaeramoeba flamelloides]|uniref:Uncharacterized protein n=1 Tax=Anaeramoeba flamelloides TaxID=1746091 RepID=A0ABQ8X921_9EUKA|nr:hypothetical protein M0813_08004 [Anaeramoeba flamelloides]